MQTEQTEREAHRKLGARWRVLTPVLALVSVARLFAFRAPLESGRLPIAVLTALATILGLVGSVAPLRAADVYTVAKYPVGAVAGNAVAAKREAIADGRRRAFRSLLKRLVAVTDYHRFPRLDGAALEALVDGYSVRREKNSRTEYLATLDYRFNREAVVALLRSYGLSYYDRQAPPVVVVPIFARAASETGTASPVGAPAEPFASQEAERRQRLWRRAWRGLDLVNALVPVRIAPRKDTLRREVLSRLIAGSAGSFADLGVLQQAYGAPHVVLAHAALSADGRHLTVTLVGRDSIGAFRFERSYPVEATSEEALAFTAELAAVVGLGVLEGRWKFVRAVPGNAWGGPGVAGGPESVALTVRFNGLREWQRIRRTLVAVPGVDSFEVSALTARGAEVRLIFPGGVAALRRQLRAEGLRLEQADGVWLLESGRL